MFVLPQRANEERVWRIFEVSAEQEPEFEQRKLFVYKSEAKQTLQPRQHQPFIQLYLSEIQHSGSKSFRSTPVCFKTGKLRREYLHCAKTG